MKPGDIYLATVGIEQHRWAKPRRSSIDLAAYIPRIAEAGFDGIELWEYHVSELDDDALRRVRDLAETSGCPIAILSTYVPTVPGDENVSRRRRLNDAARTLGAKAYKFNISGTSREHGVQFVRDWAAETEATFLCECHGGTMMEDPETASSVLRELGPNRFGAIVHSLPSEDEVFERDMSLKEDLFRHVHVQSLSEHRDTMEPRIDRLRSKGLPLTWSIEFSSPVRKGGDNETCFLASIEDMKSLRQRLAPR